jgi:polysaccharide biosynthesis protein PslG
MAMTRALLAAIAITIAATQFLALRAPRALHLPPQQTVATTNAKLGIHTRLTGVGDEAYIRRSLEQVREMGAGWIVDLFPWAYVQPRSRYGYDWAGADMVVQHARRQGLTIVARLDIVPEWARPPDSSDRYLDEAHYDDYAAYVVAFLERYRPLGVRHVIIWNEPNLAFEWGRRTPDPVAYTALLKAVYPRVKAAVPDAVVIAGGLSPGPDIGDNAEVRMGDLRYISELYAAGAQPYFDMWAVHNYGAQVGPEAPPYPEEVNFRRIEVVRDLLAYYGDGEKKLIITEGGWNDNPRWSAAVRPADRLRWTVAAYRMAEAWPWLEAMCLWQFGTPWQARTYQDNWNFAASDGTPKAIYWAVREAFVPGAPGP